MELKNFVKYNKKVYYLYNRIGSLCIRILSKFIIVEKKRILFVSYGGQRYDDSPKSIYEYMKNDSRFKDYKMTWAFIDPNSICDCPCDKIKIDSFIYFKTALSCGYWITNSSAERGLHFKPKGIIDVFCTHGMTGIKKIGLDISELNQSFKSKSKNTMNYIIIEGKKEESILRHAWDLHDEKIINVGLPRNDDLCIRSEKEIRILKEELGIPEDKKVILYAPTFREYSRDSKNSVYLRPPFDFNDWNVKFGDEYVFLLTAHYEVSKLMNIPKQHPFIIDAFKYPHINDLMVVSDLLITDYSSILFDYAILERPILSYAYDLEEYKKERGVYDGYEQLFIYGIAETELQLQKQIMQLDYEKASQFSKSNIKEKLVNHDGKATEKVVEAILVDYL